MDAINQKSDVEILRDRLIGKVEYDLGKMNQFANDANWCNSECRKWIDLLSALKSDVDSLCRFNSAIVEARK